MTPPLRYLRAIWANLVQSSRRAVQEADDLQEVVIADTPGAVHQEDQVRFGCLTDWTEGEGEGRLKQTELHLHQRKFMILFVL